MELTCLNCLGTFEVDDAEAHSASSRIQCPVCGNEQAFAPQDASRLKRPANPQIPRPSRMTTAFRKPMQAFSNGAFRPATPRKADTTGDAAPFMSGFPTPPTPAPSFPPDEHTPPVATLPPPNTDPQESGAWVVRSPTGLVLEFPASDLLVNWSAVVDNPGPYQVSRGGQEWTSLAEFLRLVRQGNRSTSAFRAATQAPPTSPAPTRDAAPSPVGPAIPGGTTVAPSTTMPRHPTSQFQIKLKQTQPRGRRRWVFLGLGLVVVAAGALVAAYLLKLL